MNSNLIYQEVLSRDADDSGLATWIDTAINQSLDAVRAEVANSPESRERIANLYRNILNREASADEINSWVNVLQNIDFTAVEEAIRNSPEARDS